MAAPTAERRFYLFMTLAIAAGVVVGFARTLFLRRWFGDRAAVHGAPEPFFLLHGGLALIVAQPLRLIVGETAAWQAFARWAVGFVS